MRRFVLVVLLLFGVSAFCLSLDDITKASSDMVNVYMKVRAENHVSRRTTVVEFEFYYVREDGKMRIEYTYPPRMKGTVIAIDGEYFYNYVPSLKKKMKKRLGSSSKNPGKDMGILFDFVAGTLNDFLKNHESEFVDSEKKKLGRDELELYHWEFSSKDEDEVQDVWFDSTGFPRMIRITRKGKLALEITIKSYKINIEMKDELFKPF